MTKLQIREMIETVLANHKHSKALATELLDAFESKASGSQNPPQEIDGVMNYWCKFHKRYEVIDNMVMTKDGASKGYCKAGISSWTKQMNESKKMETASMEFLSKGEIKEAQEAATSAITIRDTAKDYDTYDYKEDWENFKGKI